MIIRKLTQATPIAAQIINVYSDSQSNGYSCAYINNLVQNPAYPVGSIYLSVNNISPETLFGGTWIQLKDKFLLTAGDTYTAGDTGGEATHTLTTQEMPSHGHSLSGDGSHTHTYTGFIQSAVKSTQEWLAIAHARYEGDGTNVPPSMNVSGGHSHTVQNTGGGQAHNNMPPYIVVYAWYRTA